MERYVSADVEIFTLALLRQDIDGKIAFAAQYERDEDGKIAEENIESWYGAKIIKHFDGYCLLVGRYGGDEWYSYDVTGGLGCINFDADYLKEAVKTLFRNELSICPRDGVCLEKPCDAQLEKMWDEFEGVATNVTDELKDKYLAEDWRGFLCGTKVEEVYHYFDENHSKGSAFLLKQKNSLYRMEISVYSLSEPSKDPVIIAVKGESLLSVKNETINAILRAASFFSYASAIYRTEVIITKDDETVEIDETICTCDPKKETVEIDSDMCICKFCKINVPWGASDEQRGGVWYCTCCGHTFCEACFKEKVGDKFAAEMFSGEGAVDDILCPDCQVTKEREAAKDLSERICKKCKSSVFLSDNLRYTFQCLVCDEDLYGFETEIRKPPIVEGAVKDEGFKGFGYTDEWCAHCQGIAHNIPNDRVSLCPWCDEELFPCSGCEDASKGNCSYSRHGSLRCNRFNHTNDWKLKELLDDRKVWSKKLASLVKSLKTAAKPHNFHIKQEIEKLQASLHDVNELIAEVFIEVCVALPKGGGEIVSLSWKNKEIVVRKDKEHEQLFDVVLLINSEGREENDHCGTHLDALGNLFERLLVVDNQVDEVNYIAKYKNNSFDDIIKYLLSKTKDNSHRLFTVHRDKHGYWKLGFLSYYAGTEDSEWFAEVREIDPYAIIACEEFYHESTYDCVHDELLLARLAAEYKSLPTDDARFGGLKALHEILAEEAGNVNSKITNFIENNEKPLQAMFEMLPCELQGEVLKTDKLADEILDTVMLEDEVLDTIIKALP